MSKRPAVDLSALTSDAAAPMVEASQRMPRLVAPSPAPDAILASAAAVAEKPRPAPAPTAQTKTADLKPLAFKVPVAFRKRFRQRAANADLKLNGLLFEALEAWEEKHGLKKL